MEQMSQKCIITTRAIILSTNRHSFPGDSYGHDRLGDYDNDGNLDLLVGSRVFHNNGNNTFTELPGLSLPPVMYGTAVWGDYNNDGKPDILLTGYSGSYSPFTKVYKNNGDNTFTEDPACSLTGVGFSSAAWGDYDNDGDLDIILTGSTFKCGSFKKSTERSGSCQYQACSACSINLQC